MLDSIWTARSPWAAFLFFSVGLALWETVAARAAVRLGSSLPRRRPLVFGGWLGFFFGAALLVYLLSVSNAATLSDVDGSATSAWEKARIAAYPTTWLRSESANWFDGVLLLIQETILGVACGRAFRKSTLFAPLEDSSADAQTPRD